MLDAVAEAGSGPRRGRPRRRSMPSGGPVASGQARLEARAPAGPGSASGPATAASPASSAGASSTTPSRPPRNTPASSTPWASSWPSSRAPTSSSTSPTSPSTEPDQAVSARARATTGSTSSGKGGAARRPTSPCSRRRASTSARGRHPVLPQGGRGAARPARGALPGPAARRDPRHPVQRRPQGDGYGFQVLAQETLALSSRPTPRAIVARASLEPCSNPDPELKPRAWPPLKSTTVRDACEFVELARDHPVLFGTSAACDIVLSGEGILPVHGRIRWRKGRFKVEASPDAEYVRGQRPQDDLLEPPPGRRDDSRPVPDLHAPTRTSPTSRRRGRTAAHPDEDATKVLEGPLALGAQPGERPARPAVAQPRVHRRRDVDARERRRWLEALEIEHARSSRSKGCAPAGARRRACQLRTRHGAVASASTASRSAAGGTARRRRPGQRADRSVAAGPRPGRPARACWSLMGFGLRAIIVQTHRPRELTTAPSSAWRTATTAPRSATSTRSSTPYPKDRRRRQGAGPPGPGQRPPVHHGLRRHLVAPRWRPRGRCSTSWARSPNSATRRTELAELVIRIGEGLADRARRSADAKSLRPRPSRPSRCTRGSPASPRRRS